MRQLRWVDPRTLGLVPLVLVAMACSPAAESRDDPELVDSVATPQLGACRQLLPEDVARATNATATVPCTEPHTAETFAVGQMPQSYASAGYDDAEVAKFAYETCSQAFEKFVGADETVVMRSVVSWAWFRPSTKAWDEGARWYRCDIVGGGEQSAEFAALPMTAKGLLTQRPDDWMVCANGPSVESPKVPCTQPHTWRAVTTVKLGQPTDPYPGDRQIEVKTRDFCSDWVGAWLHYPVDYEYGYTWFHQAEWDAGNRRSICWARTNQ